MLDMSNADSTFQYGTMPKVPGMLGQSMGGGGLQNTMVTTGTLHQSVGHANSLIDTMGHSENEMDFRADSAAEVFPVFDESTMFNPIRVRMDGLLNQKYRKYMQGSSTNRMKDSSSRRLVTQEGGR